MALILEVQLSILLPFWYFAVIAGYLILFYCEHAEILYSGGNVCVKFKHLGYIDAGNQFGEYACLTMEPRTATVVAHTYVELYSLSRAALQEVMARWPEYRSEMTRHMMKQSRALKDKGKKRSKGVDCKPRTEHCML